MRLDGPCSSDAPLVACAVVPSERGVLLAARRDGKPPWTFPGGWIETGETLAGAAVREVREETGLAVRAVRELGRRQHPNTGAQVGYVLCAPLDGLKVHVCEPGILIEVTWATRRQLDERIPVKHLFEPVREHLGAVLPCEIGGYVDGA